MFDFEFILDAKFLARSGWLSVIKHWSICSSIKTSKSDSILDESSFEKKYSAGQVNWEKFELHEKVGARYMRNMYLTRMKADRNDENDLQNMIYVQPGDLY